MRRRGGNRNEDDQVYDGPPVLGRWTYPGALEESETKNKDLLKLVRHVAVAERVWLSRLQGKGSAQYSLWEESEDLTAVRTMFEENAEQYRVYIEGLEESELDEIIDYENQSGFHSEHPSGTSCCRSSYMGNITGDRSTGHFGSNRQSLSKSITSRSRGSNGA
jgi:hypothetical protein